MKKSPLLHNLKVYLFYLGLFLTLCVVVKVAMGKSLEFFFWRDDWAYLWSSNFNPDDFFHTTMGPDWEYRGGLFLYPYVLLHKYIQSSYVWQHVGLFLKVIISFSLYFFIFSLTKKKYLSVLGAIIYASYSGGIESYTWIKIHGLSTLFIVSGFIFYNRFIQKLKNKDYVFAYVLFLLGFLSFAARAFGAFFIIILWNLLTFLRKDVDFIKRKTILLSSLFYLVPLLIFSWFAMRSPSAPQGSFVLEVLLNQSSFFGNIGNLLKNPVIAQNEVGGLANFDNLSYALGYSFLVWNLVLFCKYLKNRTERYLLLTLFAAWVFLFYVTNWLFGGGRIYTLIGSGHRYFALSGLGLVVLLVVYFQKFKPQIVFITSLIGILLNLQYSSYLLDIEGSLRNRSLILPIHDNIIKSVPNDTEVRLISINTPNKLKSFVVLGWFPYTYAYYKGIERVEDFPIVFPTWEASVDWICAKSLSEKKEIENIVGISNHSSYTEVDTNNIYAWDLKEDGTTVDQTGRLRSVAAGCLNEFSKGSP